MFRCYVVSYKNRAFDGSTSSSLALRSLDGAELPVHQLHRWTNVNLSYETESLSDRAFEVCGYTHCWNELQSYVLKACIGGCGVADRKRPGFTM